MERFLGDGVEEEVFFRCVEDCFEPIMITDRKGYLCYVNPAWTLTYGYSREEALGETPRLLRSDMQESDFYQKMWTTILDPSVGFWRGEVVNRAKDGHLVPVLLTITPYRKSTGEIVGYMGIAVDLSDQKRMEQQILRQDRLASIGMLAGGLAHEIGNPLGVIRGRAELLMMQVSDDPAAKKNTDVIVNQIDRISSLIQSLLRVSRVPEQIHLRSVNVGEIAHEVITLMSEASRQQGIELHLHDLNHNVLAEPNHLQQLFLNLVINSMHAIEAGEVRPGLIEISAKDEGNGYCAIFIRDNGCGIAPRDLHHLFQPFFTTKAAGRGTGMGLAIVMKIVEEMQGSVTGESEGLGRGATFTLRLKLA